MRINDIDNVELDLSCGQKKAVRDIKKGEKVIKYGEIIGHATCDVKKGELVHMHNLESDIDFDVEFTCKAEGEVRKSFSPLTFQGYIRADGRVGVRNEVWIIPTVGCVNPLAQKLARETGAKALCHPWGCSQVGENLERTGAILASLARHPNAAGVLVLGLGCENNTLASMKERLKDTDPERVRFLNAQDCENEYDTAYKILLQLFEIAKKDKREPCDFSKLKIGLKCGGSDAYSGICANRLVGLVSEKIYEKGGTCLMCEIPETFGGEHLLLKRAVNESILEKAKNIMKRFRGYYKKYGEGVADNPSPGNHEGGITTLEEKSLGCIQKGGTLPLVNVLEMSERAPDISGLQLIDGPGNDLISSTNLTASGAQIILFTTGRGTLFSSPAPTLKIASNAPLAKKKPHWIDFDSSPCLESDDGFDKEADKLFDLILKTANGEKTRAEENGYYDISLFFDGAIL